MVPSTHAAKTPLVLADRAARVLEEWIPAALIAGMSLLVVVGVIARYVFRNPILGVPEIATTAMMWMVFLGAAAVSRRGLHISVEFVTVSLPTRWQAALAAVASVLSLAVLTILIVWSWDLAMGTRRVLPMTGVPALFAWIALPIGAALMAVRELSHLVNAVQGWVKGDFEHPTGSFDEQFSLEEQD